MRCLWSALACLTLPLFAVAADNVVAFPSGNTNLVSFFDASDLSLRGTVEAPSSSFSAQQAIDGSKYYILSRRGEDSITVVDAENLAILASIDLGASASQAVMTPDGGYLLVAAGTLRVIDTAIDAEVAAIPVGGAPTQILIDDTSLRAYVLAASGDEIQIVDLVGLTIDRTLSVTNASSIALTSNGARLLASEFRQIRQFRTRDFQEIDPIAANFGLVNATLYPIPDTLKVLAQSRGTAPANTSQIIDLEENDIRNIGLVGQTELTRVLVANKTTAYAIRESGSQLLRITILEDSANPEVEELPFGVAARDIALSPNGRTLFVSSSEDATLKKIDLATDTVEITVPTPIAVGSHAALFGPSGGAPDAIIINGGSEQLFPPGTTLPIPFSVLVTDAQGTPLSNIPVFFDDTDGAGLQIEPSQPSMTNSRGIGTAVITIPPDPEDPEVPEDPEDETPPEPAPLEQVTVSATVGGLDPVLFDLTIIRGVGLIKVSGDFQVARVGEPFPRPIIMLATDQEGQPLSQGIEVNFAADSAARCGQSATLRAPINADGLIELNCAAAQFPSTSSAIALGGRISFTVPELQPQILPIGYRFSVMRSGVTLGLFKIDGDNQTAPTGSKLPEPLRFKVVRETGFGSPNNGVQVDITQVSGPPVVIEPRRLVTNVERPEEVEITLGPNAGAAVLKVEASMPGLPAVFYTVNATGGQPVSLEKQNDGQTGKILNALPAPLRVEVRNESGSRVPFPAVTWRVLEGDAQLTVTPDQSGSNAVVNFGATPGQVRILAAVGNLQTTFVVTSEPPQPASISTFSGQNQTLTTGVLSDPLRVRVNEITNNPAAGAIVTFSGPPSVRLHPTNGQPPANPVQVATNAQGIAGVRVELISFGQASAALVAEGSRPGQLASTVEIVAELGGTLSTSFLLNVIGRTPDFSPEGVVNAASGAAGLSPGSIGSLFGAGLLEGVIGNELPGGATSYRGTQVRVGGIPAPLLGVSTSNGEQINFQTPFELAPGQTTVVEVENNGSRLSVANVPVFPSQPGIFQVPLQSGGFVAAATHLNGALVAPDTPADRGEIISLYYTGGGPLNGDVSTGVFGPIPALPVRLPTIVGIDDAGASVLFAGYAPGLLGVYQVNFQVREDARCGLRAISLRVGDSSSGNSTLPIRCP